MKLTQEIIDDITRMHVENGWLKHIIIKVIRRRYNVRTDAKAIGKIIDECCINNDIDEK